MAKGTKLYNISFLKTFMMTMVVLYHSCIFFTGDWFNVLDVESSANYLAIFSKFLGTFHVQTFTMASGFLFYYLKKEKNKYNNPKEDIKKRAKRLLIPYLFVSIFWVIPIAIYFFKYSTKEIINKYLLLTSPSQLWFLIMLFNVFIFFELFSDKIKISFKNLLIISILTTVSSLALSFFNIKYFQLSTTIKYILYFYLGGYIYTYREKITLKQVIIMLIMTIILCLSDLYVNSLNIKLLEYGFKLLEPLISILEVSIIYFICTRLVDSNEININNKVYKLLEDNSFGIYLFHQQIIYFTIVLFNRLVHPIIQVLLSFIVASIISLIMSVILKKNKVTKFMFGL